MKETILKKAALFLSLLLLGSVAFAQNRQLSGKVVDRDGEPIIGASVMVAGQNIGAVTDIDGAYSLVVPAQASITVSCIGYVSQTVPVNGNSVLNFTLQEDSEYLEETVVVGYGVQRKKLVTGSTVSVSGDKLALTHAVDAFGALQSQAAGVNIVQNSGQPGESYKVTIRGMGTVGSGSGCRIGRPP